MKFTGVTMLDNFLSAQKKDIPIIYAHTLTAFPTYINRVFK